MSGQEKTGAGSGRRSGLELLRMLAGMGVIVLHFNYAPGGGGVLEGASGANAVILMIAETLCICAVNVFILISGYFSCRAEKARTGKLAGLLLQTMVFGGLTYGITALADGTFQLRGLVGAFLPVNYYVMLYLVLMIVSPFINRLLAQLTDRSFRRLMIILLLIFAVFSTGVDMLKEVTKTPLAGLSPVGVDGSMSGYTIVHFVLMYLTGAYLRRRPLTERIRPALLAAALPVIMVLLYLWNKALPQTAWMYSNPLVILEAVAIFSLFAGMTFQNKAVNAIAPASFTCYLIHEAVLSRLDAGAIRTMSPVELTGTLLAVIIGTYGLAFAVMKLWNIVIRPVSDKLLNRLPEITS